MKYEILVQKKWDDKKTNFTVNLVGITDWERYLLERIFYLSPSRTGKSFYEIPDKKQLQDALDYCNKTKLLVIVEHFSGEKHSAECKLMKFNQKEKQKLFFENGIIVKDEKTSITIRLANKKDLCLDDFLQS